MPAFKKAKRPPITAHKIDARRAKTPLAAVTDILTYHGLVDDSFVIMNVGEDNPNLLLHKACVLGNGGDKTSDPVMVSQYIDHLAANLRDETFVVGVSGGIIGTMMVLYDEDDSVKEVFYSPMRVILGDPDALVRLQGFHDEPPTKH